MKKYFFFFSFLFCLSLVVIAGVDFITISDEGQYKSVKDFTNTYEINFNQHHTKELLKCQAVRLSKNWFITAAHCVNDICTKNDCSFQARLLVGPNYEADFTTTHGKKFGKKIYTFSKTKLDKKEVLYDIALIYFDPKDTKLVWKDPRYNSPLTESVFLRRIPNITEYIKAVNGTNLPIILSVNSSNAKVLKKDISVISIWSGKRALLQSYQNPIYYLPNLSTFVTKNFGVIKGISGSGVMTNTGELLGIVSATGELINKNAKGKKETSLVYIVPFDKEVISFITENIPNISYIEVNSGDLRSLSEAEEKQLKIIENLKYNMQ